MNETKTITRESLQAIEYLGDEVRNIAGLCSVVSGAFLDPSATPTPETISEAVAAIGRQLERVSKDLENIVGTIYKEEE